MSLYFLIHTVFFISLSRILACSSCSYQGKDLPINTALYPLLLFLLTHFPMLSLSELSIAISITSIVITLFILYCTWAISTLIPFPNLTPPWQKDLKTSKNSSSKWTLHREKSNWTPLPDFLKDLRPFLTSNSPSRSLKDVEGLKAQQTRPNLQQAHPSNQSPLQEQLSAFYWVGATWKIACK